MININSNLGKISAKLAGKLTSMTDPDYLLRPVVTELIPMMTERIHQQGLAADGKPIGDYSPKYLKTRKSKYKRSADSKVVVSLTRQLENDWAVVATTKGYGIGFLNSHNLDKAGWVEERFNKKIFTLARPEVEYATKRLTELIQGALNT